MGSHKLGLEIPDTLNTCVLRVVDMSIYDDLIPTKCARLQITVPGFTNSFFVDDIEPGFALNLSACNLKVQTVNCGTEFNELPDKVYVITYSVSPNDQVYVEYNYLRITKALNKIRNLYCELDLGTCEPSSSQQSRLDQLVWIQNLLKAAQAKVDPGRDVKAGLALYNYAWELLSKITCRLC